ncbi:class I tRNA ligase family protein [Streptomyces sp. NPDC050610]|uniref:class I tRNA ligase family protein n=1 Tax=Streptomyces sp. NPDC050610 TaxID=3157097 RepID=UPI00342D0CFD
MVLLRSSDPAVSRHGISGGFTDADIPGLPFAMSRAVARAGESVPLAGGSREELFVVISGRGQLRLPTGEARPLTPQTAVYAAGCDGGTLTADAGSDLYSLRVAWQAPCEGGAPHLITRSLDSEQMEWSYEMNLSHLLDAGDVRGMPFGSVFGEVPARSASKIHCHQDGEIFYILEGQAEVLVEEESWLLGPGDLVFLTPFHVHGISNPTDGVFRLASFYWEDIDSAVTWLADRPARARTADRTVVFCPPATPNGGLHVGHLAGPYIRADAFARALRTTGHTAELVTGSDDHQSFVAVAAHRQATSPAQLAESAGDDIAGTFRAAGMDVGRMHRPLRTGSHDRLVKARFAALASAASVRPATVDTPWCEKCGQSLFQAYADGFCPSCGMSCDGEICEACGRPNDARNLRDLTCSQCGSAPVTRREATLLLDLDHYRSPLLAYLARVEGSGALRALAAELVSGGLGDYRLTRGGIWGIPWEGPELSGQVIDPWVELALTQLELTEASADGCGPLNVVTFLGFDNSFYYGVLLPALALAAGDERLLPTGYVSNRFLHLDGDKFSTSRRHAVWADDLLTEVPADLVRLGLLRRAPEDEVVDVNTAELAAMRADPLEAAVREWIRGFADLPGAATVPGTGAWSPAHTEFYRQLNAVGTALDGLLLADTYSSAAYVGHLDALVAAARRFRAAELGKRDLPGRQEEARTSIALDYLAAKVFAAAVFPVMPELGRALWQGLGLTGDPVREVACTFLPSGSATHLEMPPHLAAQPAAGAAL